MTHDLVHDAGRTTGATIDAIEVTELRENTYYAQVLLRTRGQGIDDRFASQRRNFAGAADQIAHLRREKGARGIQRAARIGGGESAGNDQNLASVARDKWSKILERMSPDDFKYKM